MKDREKKGINKQIIDVLRTIWNTKGRFMAIVLMIGLSSLVFIGIRETPSTMNRNLDEYAEEVNLHDMRVSSAVGLSEKDKDIFESLDDIREIEYEKEYSVFIKNTDKVIKLYSPREKISKYSLVEGRMPKDSTEITIDQNSQYKIGDKIQVREELREDEDEKLKNHEFTVVGRLYGPDYLADDTSGQTNIGNGFIDLYGIITEDNFLYDEFNNAYLDIGIYDGVNLSSDETKKIDDKVKSKIEKAFEDRPGEEKRRIISEINDEIADGEKKISDGEKELKDNEEKLENAKKDLVQGRKDYEDGLKTFNEEIQKAERDLIDGEKELKDSEKKYQDGLKAYNDGLEELNRNKDKLNKARSDFEEGKKTLIEKDEELKNAKNLLNDLLLKKKELEENKANLLIKRDEAVKGLSQINEKEKELLENKEELENGLYTINENLEKINSGLAEIEESKNKLLENKEKVEEGLRLIDENQDKIDKGLEELDGKEKETLENKAKIEEGLNLIEDNLDKVEFGLVATDYGIELVNISLDKIDELLLNMNEGDLSYELLIRIRSLIERALNLLEGLKEKLLTGKEELIENKEDLEEKLTLVNDGLKVINDKREELLKTKEELENKKKELEENSKDIEEGLKLIEEKEKELKKLKEELLEKKKDLEEKSIALKEGLEKIKNLKKETEDGINQIDEGLKKIEDGLIKINDGLDKINPNELEEGQKLIDEGFKELREKEKLLEEGEAQYLEGLNKLKDSEKELRDGKSKLDEGFRKLEEGKRKFEEEKINGQKELDDALKKLEDGEKDYLEGKKTFDEEKPKALKEIEDSKEKIKDAKEKVLLIEVPDYNITSKVDIPLIKLELECAESFSNFAIIFPIVIYIITILVTVITMARMVEEERTQIGTLKALGYTRRQISWKYFTYGSLASLLGLVLGIIGSIFILTPIIVNAYFSGILFEISYYLPAIINIAIAAAFAFACTLISTFNVIKRSMREVSAELMRPKKPNKVKKSFMEYFPFIWNRLSFLWKVSFRNLAMSTAKNVMTIIGISGCTALLIMGFGIRTSVDNLANQNILKTNNYDSMVYYADNANDKSLNEILDSLNQYSDEDLSFVNIEDSKVTTKDKDLNNINVRLVIADKEQENDFYKLFNLRNRKTKEEIKIPDEGIVISEKLTMLLKLKVGDTIKIHYNAKDYEVPIKAINENYVEHAIIMSSDYFEDLTNSSYSPNTFLLKYNDNVDIDKLTDELFEIEAVYTVVDLGDQVDNLDSLMDALDLVVYVIIAISALLTFVVLFNLANLNISERKRELSTVRVLGFKPMELTIYVFRETIMLSILSIGIIGLILGKILHYAIVVILPPGPFLLDISLYPLDILFSLLIAGTFVFITILRSHYKLKKVDMVEALKAVE